MSVLDVAFIALSILVAVTGGFLHSPGRTRHGSFSYQEGPIPPGTMTSRELADTEDD